MENRIPGNLLAVVKTLICLSMLTLLSGTSALAKQYDPVVPNASPEAKALLSYLYEISGKNILTGQHCAPLNGSNRLPGIQKQTGHYPVVFGQDFGFSAAGTWDGINFRQNIVDEAIRRHSEGFIITLMWHAVLPTQDEPVEFKPSIQGELSEEEWTQLITPGSHLNERWKSQVDVIAWHLKQLRDAGVPVLWRPYHEMNGSWFWWGHKDGDNGYKALWRMLYERLTNFHGLNNLVWVFNGNEVKQDVYDYEIYFPGHDVVDVLATDVYSGEYRMEDYQQLTALAKGKPIGLGEVGKFPTPQMLEAQPDWVWFMGWRDPDNFFWGDNDSIQDLYKYKNALTLDELPWVDVKEAKIHYPVIK